MTTRPIVLVEFSPSGGLFQFAVQLGDAMSEAGRPVVLITGPRPELAPSRGLTIRPLLPTWHPADDTVRPAWFSAARRVLRAGQLVLAWLVLAVALVRTRPGAVLWSHWRFSFEPMFVVMITKIVRDAVFGIVAHEPLPRSDAKDTSTPKSGILVDNAFSAAWRQMDVAFVLGPRTRDLVLEHFDPAGPVIVIPHGDERALRTSHVLAPVSESGQVALFFGTWTAYKGIDVLLDAFAIVRADLPDARLVLAGAVGADIDLDSLLQRAEQIGNVSTHAGYIAVEEIPAIVESARVVITPYIRASQSGVAHLAYTFGRPVIATTVGDLPEVVRDGVTGLLVPPGDAVALAAAMIELLTDPVRSRELGDAGLQRLSQAWDVAAGTVIESLDEAMVRTGRGK